MLKLFHDFMGGLAEECGYQQGITIGFPEKTFRRFEHELLAGQWLKYQTPDWKPPYGETMITFYTIAGKVEVRNNDSRKTPGLAKTR